MEAKPDFIDHLYGKMGEPSWMIVRALQTLRTATRVDLARQMAASQARLGAGATPLDPSTLHYALKRMLADGIVEEVDGTLEPTPGRSVAEGRVAYRTKSQRPSYALTVLGRELLAVRQRRVAVEVLMDTPSIDRPKPTIFGIAASGDGNLSESAGNERPEPREWRS